MITPHLMNAYTRAELEAVRGEGCYLFDAEGRQYLDFLSGVAVNALGHCHPALVDALCKQAHTLWHASNLIRVPDQERLADRICAASFADQAFFTNSGGEAIDFSLKLVRRYFKTTATPERFRVITFSDAFHGRTMAAIAAGGQPKLTQGYEPVVPGFDNVPFGDLDALRAAIGPETAAILLEPIQGEGGIRPASQEFLKGLRAVCDERGLLLVLDEVQCGMARTGKLFAHEHYGITPDIMAVAKGIGGGFPLGACLATEEAAKGMVVGTHGSTYGGNPLAMAAGTAVLDVVANEEFLEQVRNTRDRLRAALNQLIPNHDHLFLGLRGMGLMLGLRLKSDSRAFVAHCRDNHNLLTVAAGDNVVRILPPLNIEEHHIAECIEKLSAAARSYEVAA